MKAKAIRVIALMFVFAAQTNADLTVHYYAEVDKVLDGDTITLSMKSRSGGKGDGKARTIDLDGIDAPEQDQPRGREAKDFLEEMLNKKKLLVIERGDMGKSYGAWIVIDDDQDGKGKKINSLMVEKGLAWRVKVRVHAGVGSKEMRKLEAEAKKQKKGIWADENPIPPWEWRKNHPKKETPKEKE
jgi:endonuclease YncB( thermonuclease family)